MKSPLLKLLAKLLTTFEKAPRGRKYISCQKVVREIVALFPIHENIINKRSLK